MGIIKKGLSRKGYDRMIVENAYLVKTDNSVYVQAIKNLSSFSDPVVISNLEGFFFSWLDQK